MKKVICPDCGAEYRLQRGSTDEQEDKMFAPSFCKECGHEFNWDKED